MLKSSLLALALTSGLTAATPVSPTPPSCEGLYCGTSGNELILPDVMCLEKTGPFVFGSFLYWQTGFNDAVVTSQVTPIDANGVASRVKDKSLSFNFSPGFKLGIGANLQHDDWSPLIMWTYMHSSPTNNWSSSTNNFVNDLTLSTTQGLQTIVGSGGTTVLAKNVSSKWHLNFNAIDLEIGKDLPASPFFMTRIFGSLKLASVYNKLNVAYQNLANTIYSNAFPPVATPTAWPDQTYTASNQSWLIGPRVGTNAYFAILKDFGFMATVATYVFANISNNKVTTSVVTPASVGGLPVGKKESAPQTNIAPGFDLYLGFNWGHCFKKKTYMNISAGYEFQYYGAVINAFQSLSFDGLNASILFDF